jgi:hypothetical protein
VFFAPVMDQTLVGDLFHVAPACSADTVGYLLNCIDWKHYLVPHFAHTNDQLGESSRRWQASAVAMVVCDLRTSSVGPCRVRARATTSPRCRTALASLSSAACSSLWFGSGEGVESATDTG